MSEKEENKNINSCGEMYAKRMDEMIKLGRDMYGSKVATIAWLNIQKAIKEDLISNKE